MSRESRYGLYGLGLCSHNETTKGSFLEKKCENKKK